MAASSSSTERAVSESHRVDEINLVEKFHSIGVGDPKRSWLVDSGATCHIISERWLSHYKVVYRYEVGIPVLKGAGDNVLPTRGMVDLGCKVGQTKVIMMKVVICALDLNVLSSYSLHEQGWETRLGTLKVSGLYHKKVKFPLKISDPAWWLEVQVLKNQGKSSRRKDNGPKDMEVDHVGVVHSKLSSKACQSKDVVTKVASAEEHVPFINGGHRPRAEFRNHAMAAGSRLCRCEGSKDHVHSFFLQEGGPDVMRVSFCRGIVLPAYWGTQGQVW